VLGHEGAGVVEAVGEHVTDITPGDTVVLGFASCGACPRCTDHLPSYCREFVPRNYAGARPDGTSPLHDGAAPVAGAFFGQSSFASHAIADRRNVVKVEAGDDLVLLGPWAAVCRPARERCCARWTAGRAAPSRCSAAGRSGWPG
jgi:aryl-alcohol dehydrogenase